MEAISCGVGISYNSRQFFVRLDLKKYGFHEYLVNVGRQLELEPCPMFNGLLTKKDKLLKGHQDKVIERDKLVGSLYYICIDHIECVNVVRLGLAYVVFAHVRGFDGV